MEISPLNRMSKFIEFVGNQIQARVTEMNAYLEAKGQGDLEGNSGQILEQMVHLALLSNKFMKPTKVLEIGFNAGHSSLAILSNPTTHVTSIDIGDHSYVADAKAFIDNLYPGRHTLIIGDSLNVLPNYDTDPFDFIFIDGGHDYDIAKSDLENSLRLSHKDTIIAMDDVVNLNDAMYIWTIGPSCAWWEAYGKGKIKHSGIKEYASGRGMVWGSRA
jgi:predicted O-methyltransferase YrrM